MANGLPVVLTDPTNSDAPYKVNGRANASFKSRLGNLTTGQSNGTLHRAGAGALVRVTAVNTLAAISYLHLYDKATAPLLGTDTPIYTLAIPASQTGDFPFPGGMEFTLGIGYAFSSDVLATQGLAASAISLVSVLSA